MNRRAKLVEAQQYAQQAQLKYNSGDIQSAFNLILHSLDLTTETYLDLAEEIGHI